MKRQYHTPQGIIEREPTDEELQFEWKMKRGSPELRAQALTIAELTEKTEEEVMVSLEKNWKKAMKE